MQPWLKETHETFFDQPEALRTLAAKLFQSNSEHIALVPSASYGLASAAKNVPLKAGQEVLVLADQFPSNVYIWKSKAEETGANLRTITRQDGQSWTEALLEAISPQTGLVACPQTHWLDGGRVDIEQIGQTLKAQGSAFVLDLTQSLGVHPIDIHASQADFAVSVGYKWLMGPYGLGYLYVSDHHLSGTGLEENWIVRQDARDFAGLIDYKDHYEPGARRYDMGERSLFQLAPAGIEALGLLTDLGAGPIQTQLGQLTQAIIEALSPLGLSANIPDRAPHYLAMDLPDSTPTDLIARLKADQVYVSQRGPRLRISPHIYNTQDDIDRLAAAMKRHLS